MSARDDLQSYRDGAAGRTPANAQALLAPFASLYDSFSPAQRRLADETVRRFTENALQDARVDPSACSGGRHRAQVEVPAATVYSARFASRSASAAPHRKRQIMKSGIHPEYHEINIVMTDGTQFTTQSCYGKAGDTLRLDVDPKSHPAWTGVQRMLDTGGQVAKFNQEVRRHRHAQVVGHGLGPAGSQASGFFAAAP